MRKNPVIGNVSHMINVTSVQGYKYLRIQRLVLSRPLATLCGHGWGVVSAFSARGTVTNIQSQTLYSHPNAPDTRSVSLLRTTHWRWPSRQLAVNEVGWSEGEASVCRQGCCLHVQQKRERNETIPPVPGTEWRTYLRRTSLRNESVVSRLAITVEPPNRGHFETVAFVLSSEVVLFSEVV